MSCMTYEYRTERFIDPPTSEELGRLASESWRLVSVTVDLASDDATAPRYVAYLERPIHLAPEKLAAAVPMLGPTSARTTGLHVVGASP